MKHVQADVLVIGSGIAGLTASVYAGHMGANVLVVDKGFIGRSGSSVSAVQIAASGQWTSFGDDVHSFRQDIIASGRGLSNPKLVNILTNELEERINDLVAWGLKLDQQEGKPVITTASGHSHPRSISARKGNTGLSILKTLIKKANQLPNIKRYEHITCVRLLTNQNSIAGVLALNLVKHEFILIQSKTVLIATGGIGQLYPVTSNPRQSTGDGLALALFAGCQLIDMEQIQFYPVSLVQPEPLRGFCLSFYHLSKLLNSERQRFMLSYDKVNVEDVTRDQLSFYIAKEVYEGRGTALGGVYLDAREALSEIKLWFPLEYSLCLRQGLDLDINLAEVAPAAHFIMGGIEVDETSSTNVAGLFAIGESAGGLHGGNRLGNNALSECIVFGARAGSQAALYSQQKENISNLDQTQVQGLRKQIETSLYRTSGQFRPYEIKERIQNVLGQYAGVIRTKTGLMTAQKELEHIHWDLDEVYIIGSHRQLSRDVFDFLEAENMIITAKAIVGSALSREESRGAHYLIDFPEDLVRVEHTTVNMQEESMVFSKKAAVVN